jgi:hypothetical protein
MRAGLHPTPPRGFVACCIATPREKREIKKEEMAKRKGRGVKQQK